MPSVALTVRPLFGKTPLLSELVIKYIADQQAAGSKAAA